MTRATCDMPTSSLRTCTRPARYAYIGADGYTVRAYCAQHYRSGGHARMLRPRPWEYVRVWDRSAHINVEGGASR